MRTARGFTLLEMMVVVAISLLLMALIVPIFQVVTRSTRAVERKLAVYEAARNILDILETEIRTAVVSERGEHFSIKGVAFQDTDAFTPAGTDRYTQSRREAGGIHFARMDASVGWGAEGNRFWYAGLQPTRADVYFGTVRSNLQYASASNLTARLKDVSQIETAMAYYPRGSTYDYYQSPPSSGIWVYESFDERDNFLAAGHELNAPQWRSTYPSADYSGIYVLDLSFAHWNDITHKFEDVPDDTAVYFAPPPRALRISIGVCDREKRARANFCRVAHLPCGSGDGNPADTRDADYGIPSPFNRTKDLKILDPKVYMP